MSVLSVDESLDWDVWSLQQLCFSTSCHSDATKIAKDITGESEDWRFRKSPNLLIKHDQVQYFIDLVCMSVFSEKNSLREFEMFIVKYKNV